MTDDAPEVRVEVKLLPEGQVQIIQVPVGLGGRIVIQADAEGDELVLNITSDAPDLEFLADIIGMISETLEDNRV